MVLAVACPLACSPVCPRSPSVSPSLSCSTVESEATVTEVEAALEAELGRDKQGRGQEGGHPAATK